MNAALARADALNSELNAIVVRRDEAVRAEAGQDLEGPFAGVPFLVRDMDGVLADEPNTSSSRSLVDWRPSTDSELFARYKDAGLLVIGKTNTPEFGITGVTESELRGPCHNPWDLKYTSGGSSGGSAAAVAARIVPAAHAGDGAARSEFLPRLVGSSVEAHAWSPANGSLRRRGAGVACASPHVVSRTVRDSAALLDVTHGADLGAPYAEPRHLGRFSSIRCDRPAG